MAAPHFNFPFVSLIPYRIFPIWQVELRLEIRMSFAPADLIGSDLIGLCLLLKPLNFFGSIGLLVYPVKL
jgi:hypothetical protein